MTRSTEKPERNKQLYQDWVSGLSFRQLALKYEISQNRFEGIVRAMKIIFRFIGRCRKCKNVTLHYAYFDGCDKCDWCGYECWHD